MDLKYPIEQLNETLISDIDSEAKVLHHEVSQNTNKTKDKHIMLTKGAYELSNPEFPYEIEGPRKLHSRLITQSNKLAIKSHLQELEEHNFSEKNSLLSIEEINHETNVTVDDLTIQPQKEKAKEMINLIKYSYRAYNVERPIFFIKKGNWRNRNPDKDIINELQSVLDSKDINTQACYKTAFLATHALRSQTNIDKDRISYCEGMAVPKYGGIPNQHAWLEVDNQVIELTWQWSGPNPSSSLYYGVQVSWKKVYSKMMDRPTYSSVFMPDEEYYSQPAVQRAIQEFRDK